MKKRVRNNIKSTGYKTEALMLENMPEKPVNYIGDLDLRHEIEDIVSTVGYDLRMAAPGHSIGHFTHPDWGYRLYNQYKTKGQVLALLNQILGIISINKKTDRARVHLENNIRGARKGNVYKRILMDRVGQEEFTKIQAVLKKEQPELFGSAKA